MSERLRQRTVEDRVFAQLRERAFALASGQSGASQRKSGKFPADAVRAQIRGEVDANVRDQLIKAGRFDHALLEEMPGRRSLELSFEKSILGGLMRRSAGRLGALVVAPVEGLLGDAAPGPISSEQIRDALAVMTVPGRGRKAPTAVALVSATGFDSVARQIVDSVREPQVILIDARRDGGYEVTLPAALRDSAWSKLFALEPEDQQLQRVQSYFAQRSAELESRGVSLTALADELGLPEADAQRLVRRATRQDRQLIMLQHEGQAHVARTPIAEEGQGMSLWSRISRWLGRKPTVAERVRLLTTQRVALEQQRSGVDSAVEQHEKQERELLQEGAAATSDAVRKQVANKLLRVRTALKRDRTRAQMFTQQIEVLGTQVHHLTLKQQKERVALPSADVLAQEAAQAESAMQELAASAELAANIEVSAGTPVSDAAEADIFAEFEQIRTGSAETTDGASEVAPEASDAPADPSRLKAAPPRETELTSPEVDRSPSVEPSARDSASRAREANPEP